MRKSNKAKLYLVKGPSEVVSQRGSLGEGQLDVVQESLLALITSKALRIDDEDDAERLRRVKQAVEGHAMQLGSGMLGLEMARIVRMPPQALSGALDELIEKRSPQLLVQVAYDRTLNAYLDTPMLHSDGRPPILTMAQQRRVIDLLIELSDRSNDRELLTPLYDGISGIRLSPTAQQYARLTERLRFRIPFPKPLLLVEMPVA